MIVDCEMHWNGWLVVFYFFFFGWHSSTQTIRQHLHFNWIGYNARKQNKTNKNFPIIYLRRPLYMFEPDSLLENSQTLLMIYRRCRPCCIDDLIEGRQVRWGTTFPLSVIGLNHYNLGIDCDPKTKMEILANISLSLAFSFDYLDVLQCRRNDLCQVRRFDMSRWCDEKWWCQCVCHWASDRSKTASACFTHSLTLYDRQTLIIYYHLPCRTDAFSRWFTGLCMCLCMCVCVWPASATRR